VMRTEEFFKTTERIAQETGIALPSGYAYRYAPYSCWKCAKEILVFKWCHGRIEGEIEKPLAPIPRTVQERYTSTSEETYWANTCPHCDSVQGDWFLSVEPDSPFFMLHDIDDNRESFENDMAAIAEYYSQHLAEVATQEEISENQPEQEPEQKRLI